MISQLGTPTWFLTLSAANMKWSDVIQTIARQYGVTYSDEHLSFEARSDVTQSQPLDIINTDSILSSKIHRKLVDYAIRI